MNKHITFWTQLLILYIQNVYSCNIMNFQQLSNPEPDYRSQDVCEKMFQRQGLQNSGRCATVVLMLTGSSRNLKNSSILGDSAGSKKSILQWIDAFKKYFYRQKRWKRVEFFQVSMLVHIANSLKKRVRWEISLTWELLYWNRIYIYIKWNNSDRRQVSFSELNCDATSITEYHSGRMHMFSK